MSNEPARPPGFHAHLAGIFLWAKPPLSMSQQVKKTKNKWINTAVPNDKFFIVYCIIQYFLRTVAPKNHFVDDFEVLLQKYSNIDIHALGFVSEWRAEPLFAKSKVLLA